MPGVHTPKLLTSNTSHEILLVPLEQHVFSDPNDPSTWSAQKPVAQTQMEDLTDEQADLIATALANGCVNGNLPIPKPGAWIKWGPHIGAFLQQPGS